MATLGLGPSVEDEPFPLIISKKTIKERSYRGWPTLYKSSSKGIQIKIRKHINRELNLWVFKFTCWSSNQVTICHQLLNNCVQSAAYQALTQLCLSQHIVLHKSIVANSFPMLFQWFHLMKNYFSLSPT